MKLTINGYEVEIKARYTGSAKEKRFNKADTMALLNRISIWASEADRYNFERFGESERLKSRGLETFEKEASNQIYEALDKAGYYKG